VVFAHDTEVALAAAAALVNTRAGLGSEDALASVDQLDAFVREWGFTGSRAGREGRRHELVAVRLLREELLRLWTADEPDVVAEGVNRLLVDGGAMPQLVRHDGWDWHLHATTPQQPLGTRMAVEAAMALLDVVRSGELDRLKSCDAEDCSDLHLDLSRNRSRRYCGTRCGNRADAAAYRARKAAEPTPRSGISPGPGSSSSGRRGP
jgi:predicted RNA-binding Zn ribbon-like protein